MWVFCFFVILRVIGDTDVQLFANWICCVKWNNALEKKNLNSQDMWFSLMETDWHGAGGGMKSRLHHAEPTCRRL